MQLTLKEEIKDSLTNLFINFLSEKGIFIKRSDIFTKKYSLAFARGLVMCMKNKEVVLMLSQLDMLKEYNECVNDLLEEVNERLDELIHKKELEIILRNNNINNN